MRINFGCPSCDDDHETVVEPEYYCGRLGWDGGPVEGEALPCGHVPTKEEHDLIQQKIYERIIESAHPDP
jgi:hypothetical protein